MSLIPMSDVNGALSVISDEVLHRWLGVCWVQYFPRKILLVWVRIIVVLRGCHLKLGALHETGGKHSPRVTQFRSMRAAKPGFPCREPLLGPAQDVTASHLSNVRWIQYLARTQAQSYPLMLDKQKTCQKQ